MWTTILFLVLLFVAGLISTNFPRKKLLVWFQSFCVKITPPSDCPQYKTAPDEQQKESVKRSSANDVNKVQLRSVFATFDKNNDGFITKQELRDSLKNIGIVMSEKDIADMIRRVDSNGDGLIDLDEFCDSFDSLLGKGKKTEVEEEEEEEGEQGREEDEGDLKEAFDVFDGDKDGVITVEELGLVLSSLGFKEGKKLDDCKEMIRNVDMDGDGMVNFDEFKNMMKSGHRLVPIA